MASIWPITQRSIALGAKGCAVTKYRNIKVTINDQKFDSKREAARYQELVLLQKAGHITGLTCQVPFPLVGPVRFSDEKRNKPAIRYVADFVYTDTVACKVIVEDVKSKVTAALPEFRTKRHLMLALRGIEVMVTT